MSTFEELRLSKDILSAIQKLGFTKPTEVQEKAIPLVMAGKDVIAGSETGSGKTLAFAAGIIDKAVAGKGIQAVILTPTRELAEQVKDAIQSFSTDKGLKVCAIYGGVGYEPQYKALQESEVVVGAPGRFLDHLQQGNMSLKNVNYFVLDEADRMLDMGFIDDVRKIMSQCPKQRQTLLFSATIPLEIEDLANKFMNRPTRVKLSRYVDPKKLNQAYYQVQGNQKISLLVHLLKEEQDGLVMVFCNSRTSTDYVSKALHGVGLDAMGIHGGLTQQRRMNVLEKFHQNKVFILVCTDVAARGLDIPDVTHVYNYDIPSESRQYIHRIGRTARAGKSGKIINLLSQHDYENFSKVLWDNSLEMPQLQMPEFEKITPKAMPKKTGGPRGGNRHTGGGQRGHYGRSNIPQKNRGEGRGGPRRDGSGPRTGSAGGQRRHSSGPRRHSGGSSQGSGGQRRSHSGPRRD